MINIKKYLLWLIKNEYTHKKAYFIFEKENGNKFIITSASSQFHHVGIGEVTKEGEVIQSYLQGIGIHFCSFQDNNGIYNPIERLAEQCKSMKYIKTIIDHRVLIDSPVGYNRVSPTCQWEWSLAQ